MSTKQLTIVDIPVKYIKPNPYQPRSHFNNKALKELAESIRNYGVLQPINVIKIDETTYELIAGERRLRASKMVGLETIPAIINQVIESDSAIIALIENIQRENLNFMEEAESYYQLMKIHNLTQEQIANQIGKNQSTIANKLRLLRLNDEVKKRIINNNLSERHARALLRLPEEELQLDALEKIVAKKLNVKMSENLIETIRESVLTNNHKEKLTKKSKARVKSFINLRIYMNTIKNAFKEIEKTGIKASYSEMEKDDSIEIKIRIPKHL